MKASCAQYNELIYTTTMMERKTMKTLSATDTCVNSCAFLKPRSFQWPMTKNKPINLKYSRVARLSAVRDA